MLIHIIPIFNCCLCAPNDSSSSVTACDSYTWDGVVYTTSGTYSNIYTDVLGCDSVHTLILTINVQTQVLHQLHHVIVIHGMALFTQQVEHIIIHTLMYQVVIVYIHLT